MENSTLSRGSGSRSPANGSNGTNHFVKFEPALAEQLKEAKPSGCKVSGRLLSVLYNRLLFWSKYSKHKGKDGKRYFWKSIAELSVEISYSTKQIERALYVLVELGMIIRDKLARHNYRQVWFYHLPRSPHTVEVTPPAGALGGRSAPSAPGAPIPADTDSRGAVGAGGSIQRNGLGRSVQNVCINHKNNFTRKNTLWEIVEKCELYGQQGIEIINGGRKSAGLGFG
jgi:hypothetical protein